MDELRGRRGLLSDPQGREITTDAGAFGFTSSNPPLGKERYLLEPATWSRTRTPKGLALTRNALPDQIVDCLGSLIYNTETGATAKSVLILINFAPPPLFFRASEHLHCAQAQVSAVLVPCTYSPRRLA